MSTVNLEQENISQERVEAKLNSYDLIKRIFDLAICIPGLILVLPIILLIAIAIRLDSPGSPFFIQERVGKGRRQFRMYKFRTMQNGAQNDPSALAFMQAYIAGEYREPNHDTQEKLFKPLQRDRITRMGRILRRTSLDELPQIFNVLRGEMSLIGPRPNIPWEVEEYQDWHYERLNVLPGITGLAQVHGRSSLPFEVIVKYDIEYVRKRSLKLDLRILWMTFTSVLSGNGAG
jgi:lipopolysaccharide/colanic/teichoic acid biosynthesis glycosyltransferase